MKRSPLHKGNKLLFLVTLAACLALIENPRDARANPELDRQYALETVGFLKESDNVDGLFADYVSQAYKDFFSRQSRFILQDVSKSDTVLSSSKIPYSKLINDADVLGQVARSTKSQSIIRTKIDKEGHEYRFTIDWLHSPKMERIASETFVLHENPGNQDGQATGLGDVNGELEKALDHLVAKLPFKATLTGRDNSSVTVNIGTNADIHPGDTLVVATLDEVKKHPLLHEIVDWRFTRTGKVEVTSVEDSLAFGKIVDEDPGHQIARNQKVLEIIPRAVPEQPRVIKEDENKVHAEEPPRLGFVGGGLNFGGFSRDFSDPNQTRASSSGSGFAVGGEVNGELWLNREFFVDLGVGYMFWSENITDTSLGSGGASQSAGGGNVNNLSFDLGYNYLVTGDFFGPRGYIKVGYHAASDSLPEATQGGDIVSAPITYKSLFLGVGGDLPIRDQWGALLNFNFGVLPSASESSGTGSNVNSATDIGFFIGAYYRASPRITVRGGFDLEANSAGYQAGQSASQRILTFAPSIVYYF